MTILPEMKMLALQRCSPNDADNCQRSHPADIVARDPSDLHCRYRDHQSILKVGYKVLESYTKTKDNKETYLVSQMPQCQ